MFILLFKNFFLYSFIITLFLNVFNIILINIFLYISKKRFSKEVIYSMIKDLSSGQLSCQRWRYMLSYHWWILLVECLPLAVRVLVFSPSVMTRIGFGRELSVFT